jgi:L-ascorbate metabolism protein UlaG (beta-lactamase superfamily)
MVIGAALVVAAVIGVERFLVAAPRYTGAVSDHFNGSEFFLPNAPEQAGLGGLLQWISRRNPGVWSVHPNAFVGKAPEPRVGGGDNSMGGSTNAGVVRLTFVNHATFLLQVDGINVLTDPIWSEYASPVQGVGPKRVRPAGIRFEDLPPIDVVLLSHNHYDHCDLPTLKRLVAAHKPRIYVPLGMKAFLEREGIPVAQEMDWRQMLELTKNLRLHCCEAQHFSGRGISDRNATLWCGYVLESASAGNIYFAGDTGYNASLFVRLRERFGRFRVALLPIGAFRPEWFMAPVHASPSEAVQAFADLGSPQSVAMHYGTFPLADDGETEPIEALHRALQQANIKPERFLTLQEGVGYDVPM